MKEKLLAAIFCLIIMNIHFLIANMSEFLLAKMFITGMGIAWSVAFFWAFMSCRNDK